MTRSSNTVYAQLMVRLGPQAVAEVAVKAGISRDPVTPAERAMGLGALREGVSPLEQAAGFATFEAKGTYAEPYAIRRILDRDGDVVYERRAPEKKAAFGDKEVGGAQRRPPRTSSRRGRAPPPPSAAPWPARRAPPRTTGTPDSSAT